MLVCISIGMASTLGFHVLIKERTNDIGKLGDDKKDIKMEEMTLGMEIDTNREVKFWLILNFVLVNTSNLMIYCLTII